MMKIYFRIALFSFFVLLTAPIFAQNSASPDLSNHQPEVKLWPNPSNGQFNIAIEGKKDLSDVTVQAYDLNGRRIHLSTGVVCTLCGTFDLDEDDDEPTSTSYIILINTGETVITKKLLIQR